MSRPLEEPNSAPMQGNQNGPSLEAGPPLGVYAVDFLKGGERVDSTRENTAPELLELPLVMLSISDLNSSARTRNRPNEKVPRNIRDCANNTMQKRPFTPYTRRPIRGPPDALHVYFMPDGRHVHRNSVIHQQKRQNGFFLHPVLVIRCDHDLRVAYFYALTSNLPEAIRDLGMYLRLGTTTEDEGDEVLKLAKGADCMNQVSFANMEQLFYIEYQYLDYWRANVALDLGEINKINKKVNTLEAEQNRYIYKPLQRSMKDIVPGVVLMLPNSISSSTFGAPILVMEVKYPHFRFQRIKEIGYKRTEEGMVEKSIPNFCVRIDSEPRADGEPVLLYAPDAPVMRNFSYLECAKKVRWVHCDQVKTWSYPHVRIQPESMEWLETYTENLEKRGYAPKDTGLESLVRYPPAYPKPSILGPPRNQPAVHQHQHVQQTSGLQSPPMTSAPSLILVHGPATPGCPPLNTYKAMMQHQQHAPGQGQSMTRYNVHAPNFIPMSYPPPTYQQGRGYYQPALPTPTTAPVRQATYAIASFSGPAALRSCSEREPHATTGTSTNYSAYGYGRGRFGAVLNSC